jgi:ClpP class serine protease
MSIHVAFIHPDHCNIATVLSRVGSIKTDLAYFDTLRAGYGFDKLDISKPFAFSSGVAMIPVHGVLVNRLGGSVGFATGYDFIRQQLYSALDDPDVGSIVFDINSGGGVVSGCAELARDIYQSRDVKPSLAVVDGNCYSAAYYLGSAASKVVCAPSGGVGSIGCVALHVDASGALEQDGLKITLIHGGAEKVDGNSFEPLSDRAKATIERDVGYHYDRNMSVEDVKGTEARCYNPPEALQLGLIDGVAGATDAVQGLLSAGGEMTTTTMSQEDISRIAAEAATQAVTADRARVSAIRNAPEAQGRTKLAEHLAFDTSMSVEAARAVMNAAAQDQPAQAPNVFGAVMEMTGNPNVGPDSGVLAGSDDNTPGSIAERVLANYTSLTGNKILPLRRAG